MALALLSGLIATPASAADTRPPSKPALLRAAPASTAVTLTWRASSDNVGVRYYLVSVGGQLRKPTGTRLTVSGLTPARRYTASVRAVDAAGNRSAAASIAFTTKPAAPLDTTAPSTPGPLSLTADVSSADVGWAASSDNVAVTGYVVAVADRPDLTTTVTGTATTITGLLPDTPYLVSVTARDAAGNLSPPSSGEVRTLPAPVDTTAPSAVSGLTASDVTLSGAELSWNAAIDDVAVTGYRVTVGERTVTVTAPAATLTELPEATTHSARVTAVDAAGNESAAVSVNFRTRQTPDTTAPTTATVSVVPATTSAAIVVGGGSDETGPVRYIVSGVGPPVTAGEPTTVVVTGLTPGRTYTASVVVRDLANNASAPVTATFLTRSLPAGADVSAPDEPGDLRATAGSTALTATWAPSADDVEVVRYDVTVGTRTTSTATPKIVVDGLTSATTYPVTVRAVDAQGNTSEAAALEVTTRPAPNPIGLQGNVAWFGKGAPRTNLDEALSSPLIDGLSAFARWGDLTQDGVNFDFSYFDSVRAAAAASGKPWNGMVVFGAAGKGMPGYVLDRLPASEKVTIAGETFPAFWSEHAHQSALGLMRAVAARYGDDVNLVQWRVTGLWSVNGEPWFMGGTEGRQVWLATYRMTHPGATFDDLRAAYNAYEREIWSDAAQIWPTRIKLAQAAGDAFADNNPLLALDDPQRHPHRFATWSAIRALLGERMIGQFNGIDAGVGAAGYGVWLPAAFGPIGAVPGRIGGQPIGGVSQDTRLTADTFREMTRLMTERGYSYSEVYGADVLYALRGATPEARHLRETLQTYHGAWRP